MNRLFFGDNLRILRQDIRDESVDLIYLDPPFNSKKSYNILFQHKSGDEAQGQLEAFDDTWTWSQESEEQYDDLIGGGAPETLAGALIAFRRLLGENDMLAYLVMMSARLVELHRVLRSTGSLYLHCDPTASHYLKLLLDAIFGPKQFRNEIAWHYSGWNKVMAQHFERRHDVILFYAKSDDQLFNSYTSPWESKEQYLKVRKQKLRVDDAGREFVMSDAGGGKRVQRFLSEAMAYGRPIDDVWDIDKINNSSLEGLGYPTQKPLALLERIIEASSKPGDVVLDPFCGCGTTIDAAHKMNRTWVGIDITYLAIDLIQKRLSATYGTEVRDTYELRGVPREVEAAQALFNQNAFEFERWAVSLVNARPNQKQQGDKGIDGRIRFYLNEKKDIGEVLVSVKGGRQLNPAMVRDLRGTVEREHAPMGILVTMVPPTKGMVEEAAHSGSYEYEFSGATFPRIQIISVPELMKGAKPSMPMAIMPYKVAKKRSGQLDLLAEP